jgi:nucleoside-diphosphate-sugar epimerase
MRDAEIELGMRQASLAVGNLNTRCALIDVRDMVRGLWLAPERCEPGEVYNVGGTQIYSVQELIEIIRNRVSTDFRVEQDPELVRACDEPVIAGDVSKFQVCSGWAAEIELFQTVQDMLDWWGRLFRSRSAPVTRQNGAEVRCLIPIRP